jgi:hypothetical protein
MLGALPTTTPKRGFFGLVRPRVSLTQTITIQSSRSSPSTENRYILESLQVRWVLYCGVHLVNAAILILPMQYFHIRKSIGHTVFRTHLVLANVLNLGIEPSSTTRSAGSRLEAHCKVDRVSKLIYCSPIVIGRNAGRRSSGEMHESFKRNRRSSPSTLEQHQQPSMDRFRRPFYLLSDNWRRMETRSRSHFFKSLVMLSFIIFSRRASSLATEAGPSAPAFLPCHLEAY